MCWISWFLASCFLSDSGSDSNENPNRNPNATKPPEIKAKKQGLLKGPMLLQNHFIKLVDSGNGAFGRRSAGAFP